MNRKQPKMIKRTIKFTDLDGNPLEEDFFFNLSKAELMKFELNYTTAEYDGFAEYVQAAIDRKDGKTISAVFEDLILTSYGVKSADNKRFIKNEAVKAEFKNSDAYSELFFELVTDADKGFAFMNSVTPDIPETELEKIKAAQEPQQNASDE